MKFEFASADKYVKIPELSLKTVYKLNADESYDIRSGGYISKNMIALRTVKGNGFLEFFDGRIIEVYTDTLIFFRYNTVKRYCCEGELWDFWWFEFNISEYVKIKTMEITEISKSEEEERLCEECMLYLREQNSFALASAAFSHLLFSYLYHYRAEEASNDFYYNKLQEIINYLYDNIDKNISVEEMARMAGLSARRFRTVFFNRTGKSPKEFLIDIKLNKAAEMLIKTPLNIKQIAYNLGYGEQLYFSRVFKQKFGISPKEYSGR